MLDSNRRLNQLKALNELKCGDLVVMFNHHATDCTAPHVVANVTKTKITVEGRNFRRSNGRQMNTRICDAKRFWIAPYDEVDWEKSLEIRSHNYEISKQRIAGESDEMYAKQLERLQILIDKNEKEKAELLERKKERQ